MEKPPGESAGLGWVGKHTNLVSRDHGFWLFLGEIYTTSAIEPDPPHENHRGTCSRHLAVCPTDAFPSPYRLDATRRISYPTIERKNPIPRELRPLMGNRIYGCDDCLTLYPWNRFAQFTKHDGSRPRQDLESPGLAALADLNDAGFRRLSSGSPIERIGRDRFKRNVLNAIGNSGAQSLRSVAARLVADSVPSSRKQRHGH